MTRFRLQSNKLLDQFKALLFLCLKFLFIVIVVNSMFLAASKPVAAEGSFQKNGNYLKLQGNPSDKKELPKVTNSSQLETIYWQSPPEHLLTRNQLLELSNRLRDIIRFLGKNWAITVSLPNLTIEETSDESNTEFLQITDFRQRGGDWTPLLAGHALKLVSQELEILEKSKAQPLLDFLITDATSGESISLMKIPLSRYSYELFQSLMKR